MMNYLDILVNDIPHELYFMALIVLFVSLFVWYKGFGKGLRYSLGILLVGYVVLIYCSTVFFRPTGRRATYDYKPFWSYQAYFEGREPNALIENFANVLVFVPVGLLLGFTIKKTSYVCVAIIGACISIGIELLQLIYKKGFSELDDVMHNTLGCMLGYGFIRMLSWFVNR